MMVMASAIMASASMLTRLGVQGYLATGDGLIARIAKAMSQIEDS
jgi:hypothetical protein